MSIDKVVPTKIILISWHYTVLEVSIFPIQQMLLHQMLKIQQLPAHVIGCFHLKTTVPYILYVKGLSILIDCLGKDEFDFFFSSSLRGTCIFPVSDTKKYSCLITIIWVIITKHISSFKFVYFKYIQIYYVIFLENISKP